MQENLWGAIDIQNWRSVPCIIDRLASEGDVKSGAAVFYLQNQVEIKATPYQMDLPRCAILLNEKTNKEIPIIIIQAEQAEDKIYIGFRFLKGGNGVCTFAEITLLDEPDERFF